MKTALIIGGGFAGCTAAHQLELLGNWDVTLIEAQSFLGAGVRTLFMGGHPYTFGPRHFLTQNEEVFNFLNKYLPMRRCQEHEFLTYIEKDREFYNYPIHKDDIPKMPEANQIFKELNDPERVKGIEAARNLEEYWMSSVGETLYNKFVKSYTEKMWLVESCKEIDTFTWSAKGVTLKEGPRAAWDTAISAYPIALDGYNQYFDIATKAARVLFKTSIEKYDIPNKTVWFNGKKQTFDIIINTISPDLLFESCFGTLPYIGRDIYQIILPVEFALPENVYFVYYASSEPFTRIVEYKKLSRYKAKDTLIGLEIPSLNGRHYPVPIMSQKAKAQKYFDLMPDGVFSIGRPGSYDYVVDIDNTIEQAMDVAKKLKG